MLVLTRRVGEVLKIGDSVSVMVVQIRGKQVRLGILAPTDVKVTRMQLPDRRSDEDLLRPSSV